MKPIEQLKKNIAAAHPDAKLDLTPRSISLPLGRVFSHWILI